jgi:hypothetical protein
MVKNSKTNSALICNKFRSSKINIGIKFKKIRQFFNRFQNLDVAAFAKQTIQYSTNMNDYSIFIHSCKNELAGQFFGIF